MPEYGRRGTSRHERDRIARRGRQRTRLLTACSGLAGAALTNVDVETISADSNAGKIATQYEYDSWGRLGTARSRTYHGAWSIVTTTYDALGRNRSVTTPHRRGS